MSLYLKSKKLDLKGGDEYNVLLNESDAQILGVEDGALIEFYWRDVFLNVYVHLTLTEVDKGTVGLYSEIWEAFSVLNDVYCSLSLPVESRTSEILRKKILGKKLSEEELLTVMKEMGNGRIGVIETAYFMGTFFNPGFDEDEVLWMTEGMAQSGDILDFRNLRKNGNLVVDKHSIGGVAGKGITPVIVPIIASCGLVIPNTSTRAITSPAGTSDILETVMPVSLDKEEINRVVKETGACLIWGGALDLAPADDVLIHVEKLIHLESFQKILVSIVAKKISMGISHIVIDIPYGEGTKVSNPEDSVMFENEFKKLFKRVGIECVVYRRLVKGPDGRSVGPNLEMKEGLKILERKDDRSKHLENLIIDMAEMLLELSGKAEKGKGRELALLKLDSGEALNKFWEIAKAQGAEKIVKSDDIRGGEYSFDVVHNRTGVVKMIDNKALMKVSRALGTPSIKEAGIYVHKMVGEEVKKGEKVLTLYSTTNSRLDHAKEILDLNKIYQLG